MRREWLVKGWNGQKALGYDQTDHTGTMFVPCVYPFVVGNELDWILSALNSLQRVSESPDPLSTGPHWGPALPLADEQGRITISDDPPDPDSPVEKLIIGKVGQVLIGNRWATLRYEDIDIGQILNLAPNEELVEISNGKAKIAVYNA